ncbi:MAG: hypothetical protein RL662_1340, partial [Bacteroidota bacterium]
MTINNYIKTYLFRNKTVYDISRQDFLKRGKIHKTEELCHKCCGKGTVKISITYYDYAIEQCDKCKGLGLLTKQYYKDQFEIFCKEEHNKKDKIEKTETRILQSINTFLTHDDVV